MAHTFTSKRKFPKIKGGIRRGIVDITFVDNYAAGGFDITPANLGLDRIYCFIPPAFIQGATEECMTEVTYTSDTAIKLKLRTIVAGVENATAADFATKTIRCSYWGE